MSILIPIYRFVMRIYVLAYHRRLIKLFISHKTTITRRVLLEDLIMLLGSCMMEFLFLLIKKTHLVLVYRYEIFLTKTLIINCWNVRNTLDLIRWELPLNSLVFGHKK